MTTRSAIPVSLHRLAAEQCGILTAEQIREHDVSLRRRSQLVRDGVWARVDYGIFFAGAGTIPWRAYVWAAYLCGGEDAMVAGGTAARLYGLIDAEDLPVEVVVPKSRAPRRRTFALYRRVNPLVRRGQTSHHLLCTSVADTVIDVCAKSSRGEVVALITGALQKRLTSGYALATAAERRERLPNRRLIEAIVADARSGADSSLEMLFLHDVERAHGLPTGKRQVTANAKGGWVDLYFREYGLVVELDGREAHIGREFRDRRRDNRNARVGVTTLRYGWHEIATDPCGVAAEIIAVLIARGWRGEVPRCGRCAAVVA
ncbi:uncharacterized protein DUF559 [Antricoccus suffuscus]|uniref:Uncharacterized protein DUF559 n=1 Tax=Antricoccus suffuscus TaxID=1629062 RepID=A0A2T1A5N8_9ACTN|nr:DUF559 domain-containing protein [Antricoccus suffuscus]PRZ43900.1 uncharacterized protein DUF559 [Antricoccus suffuscus]